ncbi:MAG: alpha/beta hydrolase [Burkholderiales bacterium]|nr:alpha/beta hydrolase [Burkholderiales bacterium]
MRVAVAGVEAYAYTGSRTFDAAHPTVVFVHGAANDHSVWALQSRYFAHHGRNVIAVDLPGHGRSAGTPLPSVEALAAWLGTLIEAIGGRAVALVGHSMGALAALECAAARPALVERLALLGPAAPMAVSEALMDAALRDDHAAIDMIVGWSHAPAALLGGHPVPGLWMPGCATRLLERAAPGVLAADLAACAAYANGVAAAGRVACPALVITAQRDLMAPPRTAQPLIEAMRDARVVALPNCGHAMTTEAPDRVLDALVAFL